MEEKLLKFLYGVKVISKYDLIRKFGYRASSVMHRLSSVGAVGYHEFSGSKFGKFKTSVIFKETVAPITSKRALFYVKESEKYLIEYVVSLLKPIESSDKAKAVTRMLGNSGIGKAVCLKIVEKAGHFYTNSRNRRVLDSYDKI